jgi:SAM-dependent methyltransferase
MDKEPSSFSDTDTAEAYDSMCSRLKGMFAFDEQYVSDNIVRGGDLLDIGCGTGRHLLRVRDLCARTVGLDISGSMLRKCGEKLRGASRPGDISLIQGDMLRLDETITLRLGDIAFENILLMFNNLGLLTDDEKRRSILRQIPPLLNEGGVFILHVFNRGVFPLVKRLGLRAYLRSRETLRHGNLRSKNPLWGDLTVHFFYLDEILRLLRACGDLFVQEIVYLRSVTNDRPIRGVWKERRAGSFIIKAVKRGRPLPENIKKPPSAMIFHP